MNLNWCAIGEALLGQFGALLAFFAFPAFQYFFLRHLARDEGQPGLWYLPRYGFRLVIRNLPRRHTLSNIKYRSVLRTVIPAGSGSSVATFDDEALLQQEDFFLFPGTDQILVCFRLETGPKSESVFVHTDKLGTEIRRFKVDDKSILVSDFAGTLENLLNFDIAVARRVEITGARLKEIAKTIVMDNVEQQFDVSRVREVG